MVSNNVPTVFISHSHKDRNEALNLQRLLEENHAIVYLDQEQIVAGDYLPGSIQEGIASSDKFILIWSIHAASSNWVNMEWKIAFELKKRIIPYIIDTTVLPDALQNFVFIDKTDQEHGHGELFRAIFGSMPEAPKGVDMFPGHWEAEFIMPDGTGNQVIYDLELKSNGQVVGNIRTKAAGTLGWLSNELALDGFNLGFLFQPTPISGNWSYRPGSGLYLKLVQQAYGSEFPIDLQIFTAGTYQNVLQGTGPAGTPVTFRRKD
jgi:hypothetical protein